MKRVDELSLGWRTELIFPAFDGLVEQRGDHLLVRTPHNPTFWWGNYLLFDRAPVEGEAARWLAMFDEEIARVQPESRHVTFGIDAPHAVTRPRDFADAGLSLCSLTVLVMRREQLRSSSRPLPSGFRIRPLRLPEEAAIAAEQQVAADEGDKEPVSYRMFRERQMLRYGAMHAAGLGRFQFVSTHPQFRRRGLCTALIHAVCRHGFDTLGLQDLVILADPADVAIRLYESLGFVREGGIWQLERRPVEDR